LALRRTVLFGAPFLGYLAGMLHPSRVLTNGDPWLYVGVHLAWPALACFLAWMFILLVQGIGGAAATAARVLAVPFAVSYTLYTAFAGVAIGAFVWKANELPTRQQPGAAAVINSVIHSSLSTPIRIVAEVFWLGSALAVLVALRRRAPWPALALFALGAAAFTYRHERPWGPAGMAAVLAGVIWLELRPLPLTGREDTALPKRADRTAVR
jgi:hypothetical protein